MALFSPTYWINSIIEYIQCVLVEPRRLVKVPDILFQEFALYIRYGYFRIYELIWGKTRFDTIKQDLKIMNADFNKAEGPYMPSLMWKRLYYKFLMFLYVYGIESFKTSPINNFFSNATYRDAQLYKKYLWTLFRLLKYKDVLRLLRKIQESTFGGKNYIRMTKRRISFDFLQSLDEFYRIRPYLPKSSKPVILELGAGYGRLAFIFLSVLPKATYVIVDFPLPLIIAQYYLRLVFPKFRVLTYTESKVKTALTPEILNKYRFVFLSPADFSKITDKSVDVFINIFSFAEMKKHSVRYYFSVIDRVCQGVLFNKQYAHVDNRKDGVVMDYGKYPYKIKWKKLYSAISDVNQDVFEDVYRVR